MNKTIFNAIDAVQCAEFDSGIEGDGYWAGFNLLGKDTESVRNAWHGLMKARNLGNRIPTWTEEDDQRWDAAVADLKAALDQPH